MITITMEPLRHFKKIKTGVDVKVFLEELAPFRDSWSTLRSRVIDVQRETLDISLRIGVPQKGKRAADCQRTMRTEFYAKFPKLTVFLEEFGSEMKADLSRVMIVTLQPKGKVYRHWDNGAYYKVRDRYHLVLISEGSRMLSGEEEVVFNEGELWWFDNKAYHEAYNDSDTERIHVIFDLKPKSFWSRSLERIGSVFYRR